MKKRCVRAYWADEDQRIVRLSWAHYQRILDRVEPVLLFAGKTVRFIEVSLDLDERGERTLTYAWFVQRHFDGRGLWDLADRAREQAFGESRQAQSGSDWQEFTLAEWCATGQWEPSRKVLHERQFIVAQP